MPSPRGVRTVNRVSSTVIPAILAGCIGFATYVVSKRVCVDYFIHTRGRTTTATILLVFHFLVLLFELCAYARLILTIILDPGFEPRGEKYTTPVKEEGQPRRRRHEEDVEAQQSDDGGPDNGQVDPNSPGLERFYSKFAFICENDGLPRWCSTCKNWKPDRTYHSSDMNRCVRKMDHFCPWVGGIISQTSFKFFVQFVFYNTLYCVVCLVATVLCLRDQQNTQAGVDRLIYPIIALAAFFGFFTFGMTCVSLQYIFANLTNVETLRQKTMVLQLAVWVPHGTQTSPDVHLVTYPLPEPGLTPESDCSSRPQGPSSARDRLATRNFAVVRTQMGENLWDLGRYNNWKSIMGTNVFDWVVPVRKSPCVYDEDHRSFYRFGRVYDELRARYNLPPLTEEGHEVVREKREGGGGM